MESSNSTTIPTAASSPFTIKQKEHPKIFADPYENQDLSYDEATRDEMALRGLLPPARQGMALQLMRTEHQLRSKTTLIDKYVMLASLRQTNTRLFYALILKNTEECLPLVYTPAVGEACQKFSWIYRRPEGLTISLLDKGRIAEVVDNWVVPCNFCPRIAVVTDGSRILGLGDLGWGGLGICIGKLSLYVAGAGINPRTTIPIMVDVGTNTQRYLDDPLYLGLRQRRPGPDVYCEFMDEVMEALHTKYPNLIIQFEDWEAERAFFFLQRYQNTYPMFNDDIQGTGSVILGGFINAARLAAKASGRPASDHKILMFGSGSAAIGVAKQLMSFFVKEAGLTEEEARQRIFTFDSKGLVTTDRGDKLPDHKLFFAKSGIPQQKTLLSAVDALKPTAIIGLSTIRGAFNADVLQHMAQYNARPIVFALSNPTDRSECTFEEAVRNTQGQIIFAAGSPFSEIPPEKSPTGKRLYPGQGNNFYVFPGIGLSGAICKAVRITTEMITESAVALADSLNAEEEAQGRLYPSIRRIREVSLNIACRCIRVANKQGVSRDGGLTDKMSDSELREFVRSEMWEPAYDDEIGESVLPLPSSRSRAASQLEPEPQGRRSRTVSCCDQSPVPMKHGQPPA